MRDITDEKAQEWFGKLQDLIFSKELTEKERAEFLEFLSEIKINMECGSSEILEVYKRLNVFRFQSNQACTIANNLWQEIQAYINSHPFTHEKIEGEKLVEVLDQFLALLEDKLKDKYNRLLSATVFDIEKIQEYHNVIQSLSDEAGYAENETPDLLNKLIANPFIDEEDKGIARTILTHSRGALDNNSTQTPFYESEASFEEPFNNINLSLINYFRTNPGKSSKAEIDLAIKDTGQSRFIIRNSTLFFTNKENYGDVNYAVFATKPIMENISNRLDIESQFALALSCKLCANFFKSTGAAQTDANNSDELARDVDNKRKADDPGEESADNNNDEAKPSSKLPKI